MFGEIWNGEQFRFAAILNKCYDRCQKLNDCSAEYGSFTGRRSSKARRQYAFCSDRRPPIRRLRI